MMSEDKILEMKGGYEIRRDQLAIKIARAVSDEGKVSNVGEVVEFSRLDAKICLIEDLIQ